MKLIVNKQEVDLGDISGLEMEFNGGLWDINTIQGSYAIPFTLPWTPRNNRIFGFPRRINSANKQIREYAAELWIKEIPVKFGKIVAEQFDKTEFSCDFFPDNGQFFYDIQKLKLNQHFIGGDTQNLTVDLDKTVYNIVNDWYVLYPVYNEYFFKDNFYFVPGVGNYWMNNWDFDQNKFASVHNILVPFPLVHQVLRLIFQSFGYRYSDQFFITDTLRSINIFSIHNTIVVQQPGPFNLAEQLPTMTIAEFLISISNYFNICFNFNGDMVTCLNRNNLVQSTSYIDYSSKKVGDVKKTLYAKQNGFWFKTKKEKEDAYIKGIEDIDKYEYSIINNSIPVATENTILFRRGFIYATKKIANSFETVEWEKMKDMSKVAMVQATTFEGTFSYGGNPFTGYIEVTITGDVLDNPIVLQPLIIDGQTAAQIALEVKTAMLADVTLMGHYGFSTAANAESVGLYQKVPNLKDATFNIAYNNGNGSGLVEKPKSIASFTLPDNYATFANQNDYFDGDRETEINLNLTPLPNFGDSTDYISYINWIPRVEMGGNQHEYYGNPKYNFGLRLSMYRGLTDGVHIGVQGLAQKNGVPYSDCGVPGDPDTAFSQDAYYLGARGSYDFHWKNFLPWYQETMREEYEYEFLLTLPEIKNFDFSRKIKVDNSLFFVKSFTAKFTQNDVLPVKAILIKANY